MCRHSLGAPFYLDRVAELIDDHALVVVTEGEDLRFDVVMAATGPAHEN